MHQSQLILFILVFGIFSSFKITNAVDLDDYITELTNNLLPPNYNKNIRPNFGRQPVQVNVSLHINDIASISETSMDYNIDFYTRLYWNDPRLHFTPAHGIRTVSLGEEFSKKLWIPSTFFISAKSMDIHKTVSSEATTLLRVSANGDIAYSTKISMLARCSMDLVLFPIDQQKCSLVFANFGYTQEEIAFKWKNTTNSIGFNRAISLPTFRLLGFKQNSEVIHLATGIYDRLILDIYIARHIDFYIFQVYIPACLVVIISWVPFWLDRDSHARVALGVTTVLTMTTLITNTNSDLPKISHLTALDVYLFFAFLLVFLSLLEYATVGYWDSKHAKARERAELERQSSINNKGNNAYNLELGSSPVKGGNCNRLLTIRNTSRIDYTSRFVFPITFLLFNAIYSAVLYVIAQTSKSNADIKIKF